MTDGLVQFLHRKDIDAVEEEKVAKQKASYKFMKFTDFTPKSGDIVVKQVRHFFPKRNINVDHCLFG